MNLKLKTSLLLLLLSTFTFVYGDEDDKYKDDEFLKYRIHYGFLDAGYATLSVNETTYSGKPHFHMTGKGWTVGAVKLFFKVDDNYQTYIDKSNNLPSRFIRKINEGGYKKDLDYTFDHVNKKVTQKNNISKKTTTHTTTSDIQDMLSAFYYLRLKDLSKVKTGEFVNLNVFMDDDVYPFKMKVLGRESLESKFGDIKCIKVRPYVMKGRVFKENESVTMWISDDENKIPIQIKAELAVGSLKADIEEYKNLNHTITFKK